MGIIDDYFEGYFSQEMIESQVCTQFVLIFVYVYKLLSYMCYLLSLYYVPICQVDQLVFEELMREKFPKLGPSYALIDIFSTLANITRNIEFM